MSNADVLAPSLFGTPPQIPLTTLSAALAAMHRNAPAAAGTARGHESNPLEEEEIPMNDTPGRGQMKACPPWCRDDPLHDADQVESEGGRIHHTEDLASSLPFSLSVGVNDAAVREGGTPLQDHELPWSIDLPHLWFSGKSAAQVIDELRQYAGELLSAADRAARTTGQVPA